MWPQNELLRWGGEISPEGNRKGVSATNFGFQKFKTNLFTQMLILPCPFVSQLVSQLEKVSNTLSDLNEEIYITCEGAHHSCVDVALLY